MGLFLSATAVKGKAAAVVLSAVTQYLGQYGVEYSELESISEATSGNITIFEPQDDWVVIVWPSYFNGNELPAANFLSQQLSTLVSTAGIYDGESWTHALYNNGKEIDLYSSSFRLPVRSYPEFHFVNWKPDIEALAQNFGVRQEQISCFFKASPPIKSDCGISGDLAGSPWIFAEFWSAVGISYPIPDGKPYFGLSVPYDFDKMLPSG